MSMGDTLENDLLALLFTATAIANVADNASASPITNVHYGLHTSDPTDSGNQTTNEAAYTSYAREAVSRSGSGHTVTSNSVSPDANIAFTQASGGSETETHFHAGEDLSGTGKIWFSGTISPNIAVSSGVQPILTTSTAITLD